MISLSRIVVVVVVGGGGLFVLEPLLLRIMTAEVTNEQ